MACSRIQKARWQVPYVHGERQWLTNHEAALADGSLKNGLTSRLASPAEGSQAKSVKAIQPAGLPSACQLKRLKQLLSFPQKKRKSLSERKQAQKRLTTSTGARNAASVLPWHPNLSKTNAGPLLSMRAIQKLGRKKLHTTKNITQRLSAGSTELNSQESAGLVVLPARAVVI